MSPIIVLSLYNTAQKRKGGVQRTPYELLPPLNRNARQEDYKHRSISHLVKAEARRLGQFAGSLHAVSGGHPKVARCPCVPPASTLTLRVRPQHLNNNAPRKKVNPPSIVHHGEILLELLRKFESLAKKLFIFFTNDSCSDKFNLFGTQLKQLLKKIYFLFAFIRMNPDAFLKLCKT